MNRSNSSAVVVGLPLVAVALCAASVRADLVTEYRYDTKMQMTREFSYDSGQGGSTHSVSTYEFDELGRQKLVRRHVAATFSFDNTKDDITFYVYDVASNLTKLVRKGLDQQDITKIEADDVVTTYDYDALGRRITTTDASGGKTVYAYDLGGNATKQSVLLSGTTWADTLTEYDGLGRATRVTDPEGHYRDISYNSRSLRYLEIAKNGSGTALSRQRSYYDSLGRVTKEARYLDPADTGDPAVNEDQVSEYVYDSDGRVLTQTMYNRNSSTPLRTIHAYSVNGWLTKTTDPGGGYVENLPDATGTVTKRYVYDIVGTRTVELAYDPLDRLTKQTLKGATQGNDIVTQYGYDGADRRTKMIDPDSRETTYAYDPLGRQTAVTEDAAGMIRVTTSIFDRLGRLDKLRAFDDLPSPGENQDTEYKYDLAGRRIKIKYPDATGANDSVRYVYDSAGRMITRKTPNDGFIVLYAYDKRGLLTSKTGGTTSETYGYDGAARMTYARKGVTSTNDVSDTGFAYDGLGRLTQETQSVIGGTAKTLEYVYDQLGNRLTMKFEPSGANSLWLAYGYDDLSQNTSVQAKFRTARGNPSAYQDLITYDYQGRYLTQRRLLTRYKYESAYSTKDLYLDYRPEYDDQRFMTQVTNRTVYGTAQLDELAAFTYTFDRAGDRLSNVGNRASSSVTNAAGFSKIQKIDAYGYDTLHRLTQVDYNNTWQTANEDYVYDELGNRVTYSDHRNSITRGYANDKANQYTSIAGYTVTHDDAGNLASQVVNGSGDAYVYTYDGDNRLLKVDHDPTTGGNVTVATFAYDALGRKITAWTQFDVTGSGGDSHTSDLRFYHDGQVEIADYNSDGSVARRFVNGTQYIDERAVLIEGEAGDNGAPVDAETFYYMLQELYTVTGLMKVNGTLTEAHTFDGYGKARLWHYSDGDFNRDGAVNATDQTRFTMALGLLPANGKPATDPLADFDLDGDVDLTDSGTFLGIKNGGGALAELFTAATGNPFYFTGRRLYMLETLPESNTDPVANQQLQHNRARHYSPMEGRWLQRDPIAVDSTVVMVDPTHPSDDARYRGIPSRAVDTNLYQFMDGRPCTAVDPMGTQAIDLGGDCCKSIKWPSNATAANATWCCQRTWLLGNPWYVAIPCRPKVCFKDGSAPNHNGDPIHDCKIDHELVHAGVSSCALSKGCTSCTTQYTFNECDAFEAERACLREKLISAQNQGDKVKIAERCRFVKCMKAKACAAGKNIPIGNYPPWLAKAVQDCSAWEAPNIKTGCDP